MPLLTKDEREAILKKIAVLKFIGYDTEIHNDALRFLDDIEAMLSFVRSYAQQECWKHGMATSPTCDTFPCRARRLLEVKV